MKRDLPKGKLAVLGAVVGGGGVHPNRSQLPKPPAPKQVFKPEVSGIVDGVSAPFPAAEATVMDDRAYQDVDGARVRMFFGLQLGNGTGAVAIMHRNNIGIPSASRGRIWFEFVKSPIGFGGLHITGINGQFLKLQTDQGAALTFDINAERFQ